MSTLRGTKNEQTSEARWRWPRAAEQTAQQRVRPDSDSSRFSAASESANADRLQPSREADLRRQESSYRGFEARTQSSFSDILRGHQNQQDIAARETVRPPSTETNYQRLHAEMTGIADAQILRENSTRVQPPSGDPQSQTRVRTENFAEYRAEWAAQQRTSTTDPHRHQFNAGVSEARPKNEPRNFLRYLQPGQSGATLRA